MRDRRIVFHIDSGPNEATEAFALEWAGAQPRKPRWAWNIRLQMGKGARLVSGDVFEHLEGTDLVLAADSFLAHATPVLECPRSSWRVRE